MTCWVVLLMVFSYGLVALGMGFLLGRLSV